MISKINKIKNLGLVFSNYTWTSNLPIFKKFNLIYGSNGSGKTTLSRLFDKIGEVPIENLEYEIEDEQGKKYKQGESFSKKIRVFNQDYVQNNVKILESRANSISILLGEENKNLIEIIENDQKLLHGDILIPMNLGKLLIYNGYLKDKNRKSVDRDSKFTEIAKIIGAAIGGSALRDYRKPQAEREFASSLIKKELPVKDLEKYLISAKQESLPVIEQLILMKIKLEEWAITALDALLLLNSIETEAKMLLATTVNLEVISRFFENNDISEWVEKGTSLHIKHSSVVCEYCLQKIPIARIEQLGRCFNEADKKLKDNIDVLIEKLKKVYLNVQSLKIPDRARFYNDLQSAFANKGKDFELAKHQILLDITKLAEQLKDKKSKTTEVLTLETKLNIEALSLKINEVNIIITSHNKKTLDFDDVKKEVIQKIKLHYLSTIFDEVTKLDNDISNLTDATELIKKEINEIQKRITQNMAKISSKHKACEVINRKLASFLGHKELNFVPDVTKEINEHGEEKEAVSGYHIMRGNKPAVYLSEGEKTAIAFVYFVVHLGDQNFNISDGIIVIDDPISSFDSNSLYQAFSFLKNAVKDGSQVLVFTHNFDFLKLLINWRRNAGGASYYMIKNHFFNDIRCAYIDKMDKELCEYESEYHYLFKLLKQLRDEQDDSVAKAYPVPNIARKVWDAFLLFSIPNGKSPYKKMDELKAAGYDEQKLDAIYKFTNDQSHITGSGFDPALVIGTKKVIKEIFEMMEIISPIHFKHIDESTN